MKTVIGCPQLVLLLLPPNLLVACDRKGIEVIDGDTITASYEGKAVNTRLYAIDTPERSQWYRQNAKDFLSSQVKGKTVSVDPIDIERYGRAVAAISIGDLGINKVLVEHAYAWVYDLYCEKAFCDEWKLLKQEARKARRAL